MDKTQSSPNSLGDLKRFINRNILAVQPYAPISPPSVLEQESGVPQEQIIKLDGNENPYAPSQRVKEVIANFPDYNIYPDPDHRILRQRIAEYTGLSADHIVPGSGADELIDLIFRLFIETGDEVITMPPTFGMYEFDAQIAGGTTIEVSRKDDFSLDIEKILSAITPKTKVIICASPNNPTGDLIPQNDLIKILETKVPTIIDEAYYEFAGSSVSKLILAHENLIVLRSFSKWAGLAGLRVGYGLMSPPLASMLFVIKQPYNVNAAGQRGAEESLQDKDFLLESVQKIVAERERLAPLLKATNFLEPYPSTANFILCKVTNGDAQEISNALRKRGVFIRYFDNPRLRNHIRISIGTPEQSNTLLKVLEEVGPS